MLVSLQLVLILATTPSLLLLCRPSYLSFRLYSEVEHPFHISWLLSCIYPFQGEFSRFLC